jgi:CRP-like cAMP-binding protein
VEVVFEGTSIIGEKVKKNVIKNLQKGEYFGFYGFITGKPRTASVISKGFCRVFRIKRAHFLNLLE